MAEISVLKKEVYELIAAGEVIERPASIIKELIENSIDAGADSITVEIKNGGRTFIRVTDNGCGIPFEQVPTAFLRHATSKVSEKDDLGKIMTLGFRGEALASVCAVARVEMLTKTAGAEYGTRYSIAAGEQQSYEQAGCPEGTSIMVRDLFYNVPARLKFLKKDATEGNRIQELVGRLGLSHPDISIKLIRDNKPVFVTAGDGKLFSAVYSIFGREFAHSMIPAEYSREGISVSGYVCKPLNSKPSRKFQVFFVNDRYVRSDICAQALEEAYKNSIMVGKFPVCVLSLKVPPSMIDVNVHPAKTEVRFSDNRYIYDAVYFAAKQGLEQNDVPYELKIQTQPHFDRRELYVDGGPRAEQLTFDGDKKPPRDPERAAALYEAYMDSGRKENPAAGDDLFLQSLEAQPPQEQEKKDLPWEGVLQPVVREHNSSAAPLPAVAPQPPETTRPAAAAETDGEVPALEDEDFAKLCEEYEIKDQRRGRDDPSLEENEKLKDTADMDAADMPLENFEDITAESFRRPAKVPSPVEMARGEERDEYKYEKPIAVGELFKTYIVVQRNGCMALIDKHAAHERHIYEQIRSGARRLTAQMLLEPIMIMLSYDEYDAVCANLDTAEKLGFVIEPDVAPTVAVKGLPSLIKDGDPTELVTEMAQLMSRSSKDPAPKLYDHIYATMACKAAIKAHDNNSLQELQRLAELVYEEDLRYCPHGRPVKIETTERELEKQFRRIV